MKTLVIGVCVTLIAQMALAQVIVRNDFVINRKERKIESKGITFISINLSRYPNLYQLMNGRGGCTLVVDVMALRKPQRVYTYAEIADRMYVPASIHPFETKTPFFLLAGPPMIRTIPAAKVRHRNSFL